MSPPSALMSLLLALAPTGVQKATPENALVGKPVLGNPDWSAQPSPADIAAAYPLRARAAGRDGVGEIACLVAADGKLGNCTVKQDAPALGFGAAVLLLAPQYRVGPMLIDGKPAIPAGYVVRLRIAFHQDMLKALAP